MIQGFRGPYATQQLLVSLRQTLVQQEPHRLLATAMTGEDLLLLLPQEATLMSEELPAVPEELPELQALPEELPVVPQELQVLPEELSVVPQDLQVLPEELRQPEHSGTAPSTACWFADTTADGCET